MFESNLLLAVITSMGHTITLNQESGGSLWTNESWLDTEYEWIDVGKCYFVSTPVNSVHGDINEKGFGRWIFWVYSCKFRIADVLATDYDSITKLVGESHLNLTASSWAWWALKVLTNNLDLVTLWVLGYTEFRINLCHSGTSLKHKVSANILPVDIVLHDLNFGFTSVVSW